MNIKHIAKEAGVSVATVSRVLNHPETVAPATREKIQRVMEEKGYTPNWFARGLNFNRTKTIGLVIPHTLNSNYMEIANGVEEVARQKGYITFICNMEKDPIMEREYIEQLITRKVDGLILMFSTINEEYRQWIEEEKTPAVRVGRNKGINDWNSVDVDCRAGAAELVAHLVECGHERIGILCGDTPEEEVNAMVQGYTNVLKASGKHSGDDLVKPVENNIEGGYIGMKRMIADATDEDVIDLQKLPQAIFSTSDEIAFGAMDAIKDSGLKIPEDIAVVGFGNNRMSNLVEPKLTTVEQPFRKMGIYAARILFDLIEEKQIKNGNGSKKKAGVGLDVEAEAKSEPRHIVLQTKMRVRKSCGHKERIGEMF